jgi:hypothetical protein
MTVRLKKLNKFTICPKCGCTDYSVDYMADGQKNCKKCKQKMETIMLKTISPQHDIPDNCSFCGKEGEENDEVPTNKGGIRVFKCKGCGELDGFLVLEDYDDEACFYFDDSEPDNRQYSRMDVKIAEKEGRLVLSASKDKELVKAIRKRENDPKEKCKKRLHYLATEKKGLLQKAGVSTEAIKETISKVECFINKNGERTDKQLMSLFLAAIYVNKEATAKNGNSQPSDLTERTMQETFGIDRKTMRKWKKAFEEKPIDSES